MTNRRSRTRTAPRGFTIIELMVSVSIVVLLAALTITAVSSARGKAKEAQATALMTSLSQATVAFKSDHGYVPPLLDENRDEILPLTQAELLQRATAPATHIQRMAGRFSVTSPAEYLLGYGTWLDDGFGAADESAAPYSFGSLGIDADSVESPLTGIRSPGPTGHWSGIDENGDGRISLLERRRGNAGISTGAPRRPEGLGGTDGKQYGPYVGIENPRFLGVTTGELEGGGTRFVVLFPGESGYDETLPRVICDPWGNPIQYFRRPTWAGRPGAIIEDVYDSAENRFPGPLLSDVIRLRPWEIAPGEGVDGLSDQNPDVGSDGDPTTTARLNSAEFAFASAGRDGLFAPVDADYRRDADEFNEDNLVEVGP